jgi:predicted ferric reductase
MKFITWERGRILFYILFLALPLILWVSEGGDQLLFTNFYNVMTTLGKAVGIVGVAFFAGNLILSGRYTFIDWLFHGLDRSFLFHRRTGITAFILLTLHLVAMTLRNWQYSFQAVTDFLFNFSDAALNYGRIAYFGLVVLILITLYNQINLRLKYEVLKFLHSFMGLFLFFGGLHVFLIPSDVVSNLYLRWYILGIVTLALLSYLWRTVLKRWLIIRHKADVIAVNKLGDSVTEVVMKPQQGNIAFTPGQFMFWRFKQAGFPYEDHPFSITASAEEGMLRLSAKALGDFTSALPQLQPGAKAEIQGPFGGFTMDRVTQGKQIWIAGGIGITPFMSMARSLRDQGVTDQNITLFYSVKTQSELIYGKELEEIAQKVSGFNYVPWVAEQQGFITAEAIVKKMPIINTDIFICGPKPLLKALQKQFMDLDIPKSLLHFELFSLLR